MRLFKEGNSSYYAYYRINAGISNAGYYITLIPKMENLQNFAN